MKVMVVTPYLPHRQIGHGGGQAVRDLVTGLAHKHEVLVASLLRPHEEMLVPEVEKLGVQVSVHPFLDDHTNGLAALDLVRNRAGAWIRSLLAGYPFYVQKYWSTGTVRWLVELVEDFSPTAVQFEYLQLALLCRDLRQHRVQTGMPGPRLILNSHELSSLARDRQAASTDNPARMLSANLAAAAWRRLQVAASTWADTTLCVTDQDRQLYQAMGGCNLLTVPLGMDCTSIKPLWSPRKPHRLLFVGSFGHRPNRLAARFLLDSVWPSVRDSLPDTHLVLAGRGSRKFLRDQAPLEGWAKARVEALGFVDDLAPLFAACQYFVAPLPEGGGIKIKILEAMARGIPVLTTPVGAEGIATATDDVLLIAPCDASFGPAVVNAVGDHGAARARALRARKHIEERFSWASITETLTEIYAGGGGKI